MTTENENTATGPALTGAAGYAREYSECSCGQKIYIEHNVNSIMRLSCRLDGKRVWYPDEDDEGWCAFRCKSCMEPIHLTAKGAEFSPHNDNCRRGGTPSPTTSGSDFNLDEFVKAGRFLSEDTKKRIASDYWREVYGDRNHKRKSTGTSSISAPIKTLTKKNNYGQNKH